MGSGDLVNHRLKESLVPIFAERNSSVVPFYICVPIAEVSVKEIAASAKAAAAEGPDLLEWRADYYDDIFRAEHAEKALKVLRENSADIPLIFTYRRKAEGGIGEATAEQYGAVLEWAIRQPDIALIDIEALQADFDPRGHVAEAFREGKTAIASAHFFDRAPDEDEMTDILSRLEATGAEVLKLAIMPETEADALALMRVTDAYRKKSRCALVTIAMGEEGVITRTMGNLAGSMITFGTVGKSTAPGQVSVRELKELLRRQ